jgi:putative transposase
MSLFRNSFRVESARLKSWDYSWPGWYFVTIVVQAHACALGEVERSQVVLNALGQVAQTCWLEIPKHHADVELDEYVVMPNHVHGIVILNNVPSPCRDLQLNVSTKNHFNTISPQKRSLSVVIRTYKAAATTWVRRNGYINFAWQERFYDHVIRNENDLYRIREYIRNNPRKWILDEEDPGKAR